MADEWLSTAEAARRLGITVQAVYQVIDASQVLAAILEGRWLPEV